MKLKPCLPFFYGRVIVAVVFVALGTGVNARAAFSPLFPPILAGFGSDRGVTAAGFGVLDPAVQRTPIATL
jgi:hypothetical protein